MEKLILQKILKTSEGIDWSQIDLSHFRTIKFPVPKTHVRFSRIKNYSLFVTQISSFHFLENDLIICDKNLVNYLTEDLKSNHQIVFLEATEGKKNVSEANELLESIRTKIITRIVAIGGGIITNVSSYVSEQLGVDLLYVPTTIISMSDASIGGKVRLNDLVGNTPRKHAYKTFYEPSEIILDPRFLDYLTQEQIRIGLAEVIKHAIYQSSKLAEYLLSEKFQPFSDKVSLLRAILWTADLKRICLEIDPEESRDGSYLILRAAHDISDRLEEESCFTVNHGLAVERAMLKDLEADPKKLNILKQIYKKLEITLD